MITFALVFTELLVLFFLSKHLQKVLYTFLYILTHSKTVSIGLITFLYLPGTVIHEFAHLVTAEVLRVGTHGISFIPEITENKNGTTEVKLAHVQVSQSDPIRRYLIGFAPVFWGMFFLMLIIWLFQSYWPEFLDWKWQIGFIFLMGYLLFTVSNNMFSSKKDLEGFIFFLPLLIIIFASAYLAGLRINLTGKMLELTIRILTGLEKGLGVVILINVLILLINGIFLRGLLKIKR